MMKKPILVLCLWLFSSIPFMLPVQAQEIGIQLYSLREQMKMDVESNVVLGNGDIDVEGIIRQAKKAGTDFLIIEDESSRSVAQIPQSIYFIRPILE